jgi:YbbR domain-containing protein
MAARDLIINNFWWKLLSIFLAALTWITISDSINKAGEQTSIEITGNRPFPVVPLTVLTSTYNSNQYRVDPVAVFVEVSGNADVLKKLELQQIVAFVDASKMQDEKEIRCDVHVHTPPDVRVEKIEPAYADVERVTPARPAIPSNSIPSNQP